MMAYFLLMCSLLCFLFSSLANTGKKAGQKGLDLLKERAKGFFCVYVSISWVREMCLGTLVSEPAVPEVSRWL